MVGGNRAGDGEGCSLSFELYCCYRFPIRKKDGLLYWPTTSMKVYLNHTGHLPAVHFITNVMQCSDSSVCMPGCCYYYYARCLCFCAPTYAFCFFSLFCLERIVCEMAAAPEGSTPGPVMLCVGECRPELRAQSSQLYSFVVTLTLKHV